MENTEEIIRLFNCSRKQYIEFGREWCKATIRLNKASPNRALLKNYTDDEEQGLNNGLLTGQEACKILNEKGLSCEESWKVLKKIRREKGAYKYGEGHGTKYMYQKEDIQDYIGGSYAKR